MLRNAHRQSHRLAHFPTRLRLAFVAGTALCVHLLCPLRGLDPNVWFHNVEYVGDRIGAETVTYVSNTYKYYIAYQLIMEARAAREGATGKIKSQDK
jgi:hypothetical protein